MPDLFVQRGAGNSRGPDVVNALLTTIAACTERGRNELDEQASGLQDVEMTVPFRAGLRLGQVAEVVDVLTSLTWYGKINGLSFDYGQADLYVTISIVRPSV